MSERRRSHRDLTYLGGTVAFNDRNSTLDCLVRNLSSEGAKITFSDSVAIPDAFDILIPHKGQSLRAHTIWRTDRQAGLVFLHPTPDSAAGVAAMLMARHLEAERMGRAHRARQSSEIAQALQP